MPGANFNVANMSFNAVHQNKILAKISEFTITIVMLNNFMYYTPPKFLSFNLHHSSCKHVFSIRVQNTVDPDQMASLEAS